MRYRERPRAVEATIWRRNGDHPGDGRERFTDGELKGELREGKVVRYYRHPSVPNERICPFCAYAYRQHGWIDSGGEGQRVCPGDVVITVGVDQYEVMKPDAFAEKYTKDHG